MIHFLIVFLHLLHACKFSYGIIIDQVIFISHSGRKDYALLDESFTLSCIYLLEKDERFNKLELSKNQDLIYSYDIQSNKRDVYDILKGHLDLTKASSSSITVHNASLKMHGEYSCKVFSNKSSFTSNFKWTIIKDDCRESNWTTHTDMVACEERVRLDCKGMFPKPAPICGVYNEWTGSFITVVPFDTITESEDGTYQLSMFHRYEIKDYQDHNGYLTFKCEITVPGTSWKREISHQMFGGRGCPFPVKIQNGNFTLTPSHTCQISPRTGAILKYHCHDNYTLTGSDVFICDHGSWKLPHSKSSNSHSITHHSLIFTVSSHPLDHPYCNKSVNWLSSSSMHLILLIALIALPCYDLK